MVRLIPDFNFRKSIRKSQLYLNLEKGRKPKTRIILTNYYKFSQIQNEYLCERKYFDKQLRINDVIHFNINTLVSDLRKPA